uniref:Uncharacterized protein n=2 Tax=Graphocephala atropunctata TaxID=36148 RepID=A0A1B6KM28_9HEMI
MEGTNCFCDTAMLIDLSSPRPNRQKTKSQLQNPQIDNKICKLPRASCSNHGFDNNKISPFKDPFEEVFANAYLNLNEIDQNSKEAENNQEPTNPDNVKSESSTNYSTTPEINYVGPIQALSDIRGNKEVMADSIIKPSDENDEASKNILHNSNKSDVDPILDERVNIVNHVQPTETMQTVSIPPKAPVEKSMDITEQIMKSDIAQTVVEIEGQDSKININATNTIKTKSTSKVTESDNSHSYISGDLSTEEGLKAVIAKRVNRCIQKVLNNSLKPKINKKEDISTKTALNKRSLSFVLQSSKSVKCDRLNKSCEQFDLENEEFVAPESAMEPLSTSGEASKMEDSVFQTSEKDMVFKEANKLARTFSKLAESFCDAESDSDDDLLTCQPRWMYADSSEDEEEKLRRDPALNIRVSLTNSMSRLGLQPDSDALSAFKSRHRLSSSQSSNEESYVKRSLSAPQPTKVPVIPSIIPSVPLAKAKLDEQSTKLKRTNKGSKQVPLKATMPIQSMAKESILDEGKDRNLPSPPIQRQNSEPLLRTPSKDTSQSNMRPVASSTPNKSIVGSPYPLSASAIAMTNKTRMSLGTNNELKSFIPEAETAMRQRSNSASCSGIPTPKLDSHKISQLKYLQKPKSTSSLHRMTPSSSSQMSSPHNKKAVMSSKVMKANFNPRALNEVKSQAVSRKSPKSNRIKNVTSAISGLVAGKGKKIAASDKENRFPC